MFQTILYKSVGDDSIWKLENEYQLSFSSLLDFLSFGFEIYSIIPTERWSDFNSTLHLRERARNIQESAKVRPPPFSAKRQKDGPVVTSVYE